MGLAAVYGPVLNDIVRGVVEEIKRVPDVLRACAEAWEAHLLAFDRAQMGQMTEYKMCGCQII